MSERIRWKALRIAVAELEAQAAINTNLGTLSRRFGGKAEVVTPKILNENAERIHLVLKEVRDLLKAAQSFDETHEETST